MKQMKTNNNTEKNIEIPENNGSVLSKYRVEIMGIAALWILCFHTWKPIFYNYSILGPIELFIKKTGYYGVDIFFFLSGIGLAFAMLKSSSTIYFYYRRMKRIIIPFLIMNIIFGICDKVSIITVLKRFFLIDFYLKSIYSVLWFIPAIISLYIVFPIYYKFFIKSSNKIAFATCSIAIILIILMLIGDKIRLDLLDFINRIPVFILGILYGWIIQNKSIIHKKCIYMVLLINFVLGITMTYLVEMDGWRISIPSDKIFNRNILVSTSLPFLLSMLFEIMHNISIMKCINKVVLKVLSFYGMLSLELYCIQEFICHEFSKNYIIKNNILFNIIVIISTTITAIILYIINKYFWILIEKIFHKAKD